MIEVEDSFSENDKYLIREYEKHGTDDFLLAELGDKAFVVPYRYTLGANTPKTAQQRFLTALTDFEGREAGKYRRAGEPVMSVEHNGRDYVIPYGMAGTVMPEKLAQELEEKAAAKYNAVINAARALDKLGEAPEMTDFSSFAADKYSDRLAALGAVQTLDEKTPERLKIMDFLRQSGNKNAKKFKTTTGKMLKSIGKKMIEAECGAAKKYMPSGYKAAALATLIGAGAAVYHYSGSEEKESKKAQKTEMAAQRAEFTDFTGKVYADPYGNIMRMNELRADITAMLIAVEGFSDKAFKDGGGTPTIGIGMTFYLDEKGKETPVKMGDSITLDEAMVQKWRFVQKKMMPLFGEKMPRKCSDGDILGGIGAGFCWGMNGFGKSEYFKSIQNGESLENKIRKISGFRKQKGLLKRGYLLANFQAEIWKGSDVLDMPIFKYKDKGFLNCGIYRCELNELLPCRKNENGNFLLDEDGNNVPKIADDGFCLAFYTENADSIRHKMIAEAIRGKEEFRTVRDFMPKETLEKMAAPEDVFMATYRELQQNKSLQAQKIRLASVAKGR